MVEIFTFRWYNESIKLEEEKGMEMRRHD